MMTFKEALDNYPRIALVGGPKTGKTTLSKQVKDRPVIHGDDYKHMEWSQQSEQLVALGKGRSSFLMEGVQVPRALRKGLVVDAVVHCIRHWEVLTEGQDHMNDAVETIIKSWRSNNPDVPVILIDE